MVTPAPGSRWAHKRDRRVVVVVANGETVTGTRYIEYRYERTAGGMGSHRGTPVQSMALETWRGIFTKPAPEKTR